MRLVTYTFIRNHRDEIIAAWEAAAAAEQREIQLSGSALRDHLPQFLDELATWLAGAEEPGASRLRAAATEHAAGRFRDAYHLTQLISEFRLLRTTILRLLLQAGGAEQASVEAKGKEDRVVALARLNAGIDHAITDAVEHFTATTRRETEEQLRVTEERFRALVTATSDVVYQMSPDWSEMRRLHGRDFIADTEDPTSTWLRKYIHPNDQLRVMGVIREAIRTKSTFQLEHQVLRVDGTLGWTFSRAIPILDANSEIVEWFGAASDVTQRKRGEEATLASEERLRALADSMPQLAWTAHPDGYISWYNRRWYKYTGTTSEQMEGWGWQSVHDPATLPDVMRRWKASIESGTAFEMEFPLRGADGTFRRFLTRAFPLKNTDGKVLQWFGTSTDVTELVVAQEALRETARRKDEFIGMLSHELRNPLAPIRNSIYVLRHAQPGGEQAIRAQSVIERQTDHLARLVDDLLDITRIASGKIELRRDRLDLREIVRRAAEDFRTLMEDRGITFEIAVPDTKVWADIDATRVAQVIGNVLHNAAKHSRREDRVVLTLRVDGADAEISVRDTGVGIDPALLPHVFEPFVQGDRTLARTEGGLGLGLALVKGITELHGGTVMAESPGIGKGATVIVRLPLVNAVVIQGRTDPVAQPINGARRVLVVDDNEDAAESLAEYLRMLNHSVDVAFDGPSAIEKARTRPPDVVLCDIGMPGMSGYEVALALRAAHGSDMQLVAVSGYAQPEDVKKAVESGFDAHVPKPPDLRLIERLLG